MEFDDILDVFCLYLEVRIAKLARMCMYAAAESLNQADSSISAVERRMQLDSLC